MDNYHYIIAGLPELILNTDNKSFSYDLLRDSIYCSSSAKDRRFIEWFDFGTNDKNLNSHFYKAALACKSLFIKKYFALDLEIRNRKVDFIKSSEKNESNENKYKMILRGYVPIELTPEETEQLNNVFTTSNILEKEQMLDKFKWDYINSFNKYGEFNMNVILAFLAKGKLIDRWNKLDKKAGELMFKKLVDEVRGTFTGIDFKNN
ncbi:MAG: DUF2764 family protein [Bacteroidales bacterium]